jgi:exosome complex component RRP42
MSGISAAERQYIEEGILENIRNDGWYLLTVGRTTLDYRRIYIETGVLDQSNGSARLRQGQTDVLVGVKADLARPDEDRPTEGLLSFTVDCCPSASPEFDSRGVELLNIELARYMQKLFASRVRPAVDLAGLCLKPKFHCWALYVDVAVLGSDGNLFDAISIACRAALWDTRLPVISLIGEEVLSLLSDRTLKLQR